MAKIPLPHHGYEPTTITHKGLQFRVHHERDAGHEPPWEDGDGRGIVTDWINTGHLEEDSQERDDYHNREKFRPLNFDHGRTRFYDFAATLEKAREEQWGLAPKALAQLAADKGRAPTEEEITYAAVEADYQFILDWCEDRWEYVGVVVTLEGTDCQQSLWGIESCATEYLQEVARELAEQIIDTAADALLPEIAALQATLAAVQAAKSKKVRKRRA